MKNDIERGGRWAYRRAKSGVRVLLVVSFVAMLMTSPVAGQDSTEVAACEYGPPVPADTGEGSEIETAFTLDASGSMTDSADEVRTASKNLVGSLDSNDEVAAVSFSEPTTVLQQLTGDFTAANNSIDSYTPSSGRFSGIGPGIDASANELLNSANANTSATKVLVLVSDGSPTSSDTGVNATQEAIDAANSAKQNGIVIVTITVGTSDTNPELMEQLASSPSLAYIASEDSDIGGVFEQIEEDIKMIDSGLRVETRDLYQPGESHPYEVYNVTYGVEDNETVVIDRTEVTDAATVTSSNATILEVDSASSSLVATDDASTATWVRVDASYQGETGCTNVIVAEPTVKNLQLVPGVWRVSAIAGDSTMFALLIATLFAVPAARFTSAFGGLAIGQMVLVVGWLAGYVGFGIASASVFVSLFIGLNLAANINYQAGRLGGGR